MSVYKREGKYNFGVLITLQIISDDIVQLRAILSAQRPPVWRGESWGEILQTQHGEFWIWEPEQTPQTRPRREELQQSVLQGETLLCGATPLCSCYIFSALRPLPINTLSHLVP